MVEETLGYYENGDIFLLPPRPLRIRQTALLIDPLQSEL